MSALESLNDKADELERVLPETMQSAKVAVVKREGAKAEVTEAETNAAGLDIDARWKGRKLNRVNSATETVYVRAMAAIKAAEEERERARKEAEDLAASAEIVHLDAEHNFMTAMKVQVLAELRVHLANEVVRKAVIARDSAVGAFERIKKETKLSEPDLGRKALNSVWAAEGARAPLTHHDRVVEAVTNKEEAAYSRAAAIKAVAERELQETEGALNTALESLSDARERLEETEEEVIDTARLKGGAEDAIKKVDMLIEEKAGELSGIHNAIKRCASAEEQASSLTGTSRVGITWFAQAERLLVDRIGAKDLTQ